MANVQTGTRIGPYRVDSVLPGRGGFAQVVCATRVMGNGQPYSVALKLARTDTDGGMDPESYGQALGNEVDTLRMLKHPGIVRIYPIPIDERRGAYRARAENLPGSPWYFVMEYLAGGTVEELVLREHALELPLAVEIAHQVAAALDYIHANGYYHLDIKTNNIVFRHPVTADRTPEAVLIDFGAAQKSLRRAEVEAGALMYLPPERVQVLVGHSPPETVINRAAADIYALGITLYRMLTGDLPFRGQRDHVTTAILSRAPTRPMQINRDLITLPDLDALIMQMLEKDPERRPGIKEVMARLDQAVPPPRSTGAHLLPAPPTPGRGWKRAALALAAFAVLEAGALGYAVTQQPGLIPGTGPAVSTATVEAPAPTTAPEAPTEAPVVAPTKKAPTKKAPATTRPPTATPVTPTRTPTKPVNANGPEPTLVPTFTAIPTKRPAATKPPVVTAAPQNTPGTQP